MMPGVYDQSDVPSVVPNSLHARQMALEEQFWIEKQYQPGVGFPSPSLQTNLLIVRLDLATRVEKGGEADEVRVEKGGEADEVRKGLRKLCQLFADIDSGRMTIEVLDHETGQPVQTSIRKKFHFSATIGFGQGFFDQLDTDTTKLIRPRNLKTMPDHQGLGDVTPYSLAQTDMILQLGSSSAFVNRWVLEHALAISAAPAESTGAGTNRPPDIVTAVAGWATITDVHAGFQRTDGRNLMGFNDGISNMRALSQTFQNNVWATGGEPPALATYGTYMVFLKILHDLDQWRELDETEQEKWVGRSKGTGLLLGTLDPDKDKALAKGLRAGAPAAVQEWKRLMKLQSNPAMPFFSPDDPDPLPQHLVEAGFSDSEFRAMAKGITAKCPKWSHVRKVNPRGSDSQAAHLIFRRGYVFTETSLDNKVRSGLLFICFQANIKAGFEFIKTNWANHQDFPDPQTGREGLAGPSQGATVKGAFLATVPLGGGYYFIPPIPPGGIAEIGQQFFPAPATEAPPPAPQ